MWDCLEIPNCTESVQQHKELDLKNRVETEDGADNDEDEKAEQPHGEVVHSKLASEVHANKHLSDSACFPMQSVAFGREIVSRHCKED